MLQKSGVRDNSFGLKMGNPHGAPVVASATEEFMCYNYKLVSPGTTADPSRRGSIIWVIGKKVCLRLNPNWIGTGRRCANRSS